MPQIWNYSECVTVTRSSGLRRGTAWLLALFLVAGPKALGDELSVPRLALSWRSPLNQEYSADGIYIRDGFAYVGTGGPDARVAKIRLTTGEARWMFDARASYQTSYPVSNGKLVVFGQVQAGKIIGLDDSTGEKLWEAQAQSALRSACTFHGDLVLIGSDDHCLYAIDWATGQVRWKTRLAEGIRSRPCVTGDRAYVGCLDRYVWAINLASGKVEMVIECAGRIQYDLFTSHGLIFLAADKQWVTDRYDSNKQRKEMTIIDARGGKILRKLVSDSHFSPQIVELENVVYFWDMEKLYAYDAVQRQLRWTAQAPRNIRPFPILLGDQIVLAMNQTGDDRHYDCAVVTIDRKTGKQLGRRPTGGISLLAFGHYRQIGDLLLTTDHRLTCYRISVAPD